MKNQFIENFRKKAWKNIYNHNLLEPDDKIIVGISGGVDSLVLLDILSERKKSLPFKIELYAAHVFINSIGYKIDINKINDICTKLDVKYIQKDASSEFSIKDLSKAQCFYCSWTRRKTLFKLADELNCNKVALGHNLEDSIETMFLNMIYHKSISAIPEKLSMFDGRLILIRPLIFFKKEDIEHYSKIMDYNAEIEKCKYSELNKRKKIKELINEINKINKHGLRNILRAPEKIFHEYLPKL